MQLELITTVASALFFITSLSLALHVHHSEQRIKSAVPRDSDADESNWPG